MCLSCLSNRSNSPFTKGKEAIFNALTFTSKDKEEIKFPVYINTYDNRAIKLTDNQIDEIINNASVILCTRVDFKITIWSIQWPNDYQVKTLQYRLITI